MNQNLLMTGLKECPFCGCGEIRIHKSMHCLECVNEWLECMGCLIEVKFSDSISEAIRLWNKRVNE